MPFGPATHNHEGLFWGLSCARRIVDRAPPPDSSNLRLDIHRVESAMVTSGNVAGQFSGEDLMYTSSAQSVRQFLRFLEIL